MTWHDLLEIMWLSELAMPYPIDHPSSFIKSLSPPDTTLATSLHLQPPHCPQALASNSFPILTLLCAISFHSGPSCVPFQIRFLDLSGSLLGGRPFNLIDYLALIEVTARITSIITLQE